MKYIGTIPNKYKEGTIVFSRLNPEVELIIRRYVDMIYYCKQKALPDEKDLVFFEREIMAKPG